MSKEIGNRIPVDSGMIKSIGYDEPSEVLEIQFPNGTIYQYADVPKSIYGSLMSAPSIGSFFHANVKNAFQMVKL